MPAGLYPVSGILYETDGTTALASTTVKLRNDNTNKVLTETTNASGQFVFDSGNFPSGWTDGDKLTLYTIFQNYDSAVTLTINLTDSPDGLEQDLTLSTVVDTVLRYFSPQEFLDFFGLSSIEEDPQNGIKTQTIVKMGEGVELHIERILNRTYDDNQGDNYQVTEELHNADFHQRMWFLKKTPIISIQRFEVNMNLPGESEDFRNIMFQELDNCDAITDWSASTDGAITLNTTNGEFNEGTGALNITKTGATQSTVTFSKTLSETFDFTRSIFKMNLFVADTSEIASTGSTQAEIQIGSDSSNYYSKTFDNIAQGNWVPLSLWFDSSDSSASTTGTPDAENCDYVAIKITYASSATTVSAGDMRLDNIRLNEKDDLDVRLDLGRVSIATFSDFLSRPVFGYYHRHFIEFPEPGKDQVKITYKHGQSVPSDIKRLAILMTARGMGAQMLGALNIKVSEASGLNSNLQNLNNFDKEINEIIENRRFPQIENVWR